MWNDTGILSFMKNEDGKNCKFRLLVKTWNQNSNKSNKHFELDEQTKNKQIWRSLVWLSQEGFEQSLNIQDLYCLELKFSIPPGCYSRYNIWNSTTAQMLFWLLEIGTKKNKNKKFNLNAVNKKKNRFFVLF